MQALAMARNALDELASGRAVADGKLQELTRTLEGLGEADPIVRAALALERVARDGGITLDTAFHTTNLRSSKRSRRWRRSSNVRRRKPMPPVTPAH
jgi:hypothetical protein